MLSPDGRSLNKVLSTEVDLATLPLAANDKPLTDLAALHGDTLSRRLSDFLFSYVKQARVQAPQAAARRVESGTASFRPASEAERGAPVRRPPAATAPQSAGTTPRVFASLDDLRRAVADCDLAKTFGDSRVALAALPPAGRAAVDALLAQGGSQVNTYAFEAPLGKVSYLLSRAPPPAPVLQLLDRSGKVVDEARRPRTDFSWQPHGPASVRDFASGNLREVSDAQRSTREALPEAVRSAASGVPENANWFHPEEGVWLAQWLDASGSNVVAFDDQAAVIARGTRPFSVFAFDSARD